MDRVFMMRLGAGFSEIWVNWLISLFVVVALAEGVLGWLIVFSCSDKLEGSL